MFNEYIGGMYWENQMRATNKKETENELQQDKLHNKMPCNNCNINDICRYAFSIKCSSYNAELFDIKISCKRYVLR